MTLRLDTVVSATACEVLQTQNATLAGRKPAGRNPLDAWHSMGHAANSVFILPPRHKWRAVQDRHGAAAVAQAPLNGDALRPLLRDPVLGMLRHVLELAASGEAVEADHAAFATMADLQWRAMFSAGLDEVTSIFCMNRA
jgi:hypothetical protein